MAKLKLSISLDENLVAKLRSDAEKDNRNLSNYIETKLTELLNN